MKLEEEELNFIKESTAKLNNAKSVLGELEIKKYEILSQIDSLKKEYQSKEKQLIDKYGLDSVINMETGEVTQKTE
tara:strand:+ start:5013 stop:5240 length:228 start_codon:yes stop_codon:yes gene_type:complete